MYFALDLPSISYNVVVFIVLYVFKIQHYYGQFCDEIHILVEIFVF